jgi:hypothetical protein
VAEELHKNALQPAAPASAAAAAPSPGSAEPEVRAIVTSAVAGPVAGDQGPHALGNGHSPGAVPVQAATVEQQQLPAGAEGQSGLADGKDVVMADAEVPVSGNQGPDNDAALDGAKADAEKGAADVDGTQIVGNYALVNGSGHITAHGGQRLTTAAAPAGPDSMELDSQGGGDKQLPNGVHTGALEQQPRVNPAAAPTSREAGASGSSPETLQLWGYTLRKEVRRCDAAKPCQHHCCTASASPCTHHMLRSDVCCCSPTAGRAQVQAPGAG